MKDKSKNKDEKDYEIILTTWNKGKFGKYKLLKKNNKIAFDKSTK
tara:strand:+ start:554 stop:688 length:135 start_codon:yes stop_codon:yes gene_type:complete